MRKIGLFLILFLIICTGYTFIFPNQPYSFPKLKYFPQMPEADNNLVTVEGVKLGRYLFYDPILSSDSTMACGSCHKQEFAFSDSPNKFSKGRNEIAMVRNTLPLFNLAWYPALFWDGKAKSIEDQIAHPIKSKDEMNLEFKIIVNRLSKNGLYKNLFYKAFGTTQIDSIKVCYAISQFLRTLISYQSKYDRVISGNGSFSNDEFEGYIIVNDQTKGDCLHCHTTDADALGTTLKFSNNGLDAVSNPSEYKDKGRGLITSQITDNGKFKIPSLRNLLFTSPYMHDGRFKTLNEVLDFYSEGVNNCVNIDSKMEFVHQKGNKLTSSEKQKVIAFLKTLSDSVFITNPEFSNPFQNN